MRTAERLNADLIELKPRFPAMVLLATLTGISTGNRELAIDPGQYDRIILCGPVYMGKFSSPCMDFIKRQGRDVEKINVITCCASQDETKYETFGYGKVFDSLRDRLGRRAGHFQAFPLGLLDAEGEIRNGQELMNTRLTEASFIGGIRDRFENFIHVLTAA